MDHNFLGEFRLADGNVVELNGGGLFYVAVGSYAGEAITHIRVVQSYTREPFEIDAFNKEVERAFGIAKRRIRQRSFLICGAILLLFVGMSGMLHGLLAAGIVARAPKLDTESIILLLLQLRISPLTPIHLQHWFKCLTTQH